MPAKGVEKGKALRFLCYIIAIFMIVEYLVYG